MNKNLKIAIFGLLLWLIPFFTGFAFVDPSGNFLIDQIFFKTIMILEGGLIGVILAIKYFACIEDNYLKEGMIIGVAWFAISLILDLVFVAAGFFQMSYAKYFTDIGLRYLFIPMYMFGIGYILEKK